MNETLNTTEVAFTSPDLPHDIVVEFIGDTPNFNGSPINQGQQITSFNREGELVQVLYYVARREIDLIKKGDDYGAYTLFSAEGTIRPVNNFWVGLFLRTQKS